MNLILINEFGNKIYIDVENRGVEVQLIIEGPTTTFDCTLTYKEAEALRRCMVDEGV